jgi:hypothetical protein
MSLGWVKFYRSRGLTVLKVDKGSKRCLIDGWNRLPPEELEKMITEEDNIGIRLDGLSVLDFERPELVEALFTEGVDVLSQHTWVAKTGRGFHIYMRGLPSGKKIVKADGLVEFRSGSDLFCVAPPSLHPSGVRYEWVTDVERVGIAEVSPQALERMRRKVEVLQIFEGFIKGLEKAWTESHRHNLSLWLSGVLFKLGYSLEEAEVVLKAVALLAHDSEVNDRVRALADTYKKDRSEVGAWTKLKTELESIVGVDRARELLSLLPRPQKTGEHAEGPGAEKPKGKSVLSLSLPKHGFVLEAVGVPNGLNSYDPKLLVLGPQGFEMHDFLLVDGVELRPRSPRSYPYMPYAVEDFTVKSRAELVELVRAEVDKFVDAEPEEKAIFTGLIILSYCQELFETVPYLYLVGDNSSGKSHLLQLFNHLCYRPLFGVSLTHADIYSYLEDDGLPLTILEDEFQGSEKDNEKMKVYKAGYKKDARVPRVVLFEGGRRVDYFNCFGLKAFAAEQLVENKGFLERCIVVELVEGYPEKDHYESEDLKRFAWLRGELLKWRMSVLAGRENLPKLEFDWLKGRDRELYQPLLTVLEGTALYPLLERTLFARVEERKKEKAASLEASVCRVVKRLMDLGKELSFADIWLELSNDLGAYLEYRPGSQISDAMNSEAYGRITKKQLSTILRDKLGMNRLRPRKEGKRIIVYTPNPSKLAKAFRKYGIDGPDGHGGHGGHGCSSIAPLENPAKKA